MEIRPSTLEDAEKILSLQKLAYQSEAALYPGLRLPPLHETLDEIRSVFDTYLFLIAVVEGKVVGSARATVREGACQIGRLVVHPDHQNQGIGTALLREVERRHPSALRFELFTGGKSEKNLRLYQRLGYKPFKTESLDDGVTLIYMDKWNPVSIKEP